MNRVPPLHDLTAFEAAARHLSFLRASDELHVTQPAISHRIKSLEEFLGVRLILLLLCGGDKSTQDRNITQALKYLKEFDQRTP